ncbi:MAG: hypothetical protein AAGG02_11350 [Cyanobacteria bacterium P01_H01_bin.15]
MDCLPWGMINTRYFLFMAVRLRSLSLLFAGLVCLGFPVISVAQKISLDQLCSKFPENVRCKRVAEGLPSVESGVPIPDNCTALKNERTGQTRILAGGGSTIAGIPGFSVFSRNRGINYFVVPGGLSISKFVGVMQSRETAEFRIEMRLDPPRGSSQLVYAEKILLFEKQRHAFAGQMIQPRPSRVKIVTRGLDKPRATYDLKVLACP